MTDESGAAAIQSDEPKAATECRETNGYRIARETASQAIAQGS
jgi:hypothetical protein